jgi:rRNA biogenesis protein RRP5
MSNKPVNKKITKMQKKLPESFATHNDEPIDKFTAEKMNLEKSILLNPNSSECWIHMIAFVTERESVVSGREQNERALAVINFRNDIERMNLWKCYINLEYFFGSVKTLNEVGKRAMGACDRQKIINHMVSLHTQDKKFEEAEELIKVLLKKPENKFAAWLSNIEVVLAWGDFAILNANKDDKEEVARQYEERVKELLRRALQSLDRREHVNFLTQYGVLEYRHRNFLNARTTFENLVSNFPKRNNLW